MLVAALLGFGSTPAYSQDEAQTTECERVADLLTVPRGWELAEGAAGSCFLARGAITPAPESAASYTWPREVGFTIEEQPRLDGETPEQAVSRFLHEPGHLPGVIGGQPLARYTRRAVASFLRDGSFAVIEEGTSADGCNVDWRWRRAIAASDDAAADGLVVLFTYQTRFTENGCGTPLRWDGYYGGTRDWEDTTRTMRDVISHLRPGLGHVEVCRQVADIPFANFFHFEHWWLRTGTQEAGLGPAGGGVPGENGQVESPYVTVTEIVPHPGRGETPGATCTSVPDIDEECVNRELTGGGSRGRWAPWNQCQTVVIDILMKCGGAERRRKQREQYCDQYWDHLYIPPHGF